MIGIQGETALDEVTKSPADAELSTTSTNSVQNKVVTKKINEINNDLGGKIIYTTTGSASETRADVWTRVANNLINYDQKTKSKMIVVDGLIGTNSVNVYRMTRVGATGNFALRGGYNGNFMDVWARPGGSSTEITLEYNSGTWSTGDVSGFSAGGMILTIIL